MKEITEGKAALDSRLEPNEEIRSIILCAYNARLSARYTPYRGVLAATDRRFMFYSSLFGSPFHLDIRYDAVTSFRQRKAGNKRRSSRRDEQRGSGSISIF
ncbi:hypothetical protein UF14_20520 [Bacillus licheniformis]|nr:hypothetical protein UF14_20520 [Bacillus licheniformis]